MLKGNGRKIKWDIIGDGSGYWLVVVYCKKGIIFMGNGLD